MGHDKEQSEKEREETACAQCFCNWYNSRHGTNCTFERAEKFFPELAHKTRWEFVVFQRGNSNQWRAIEVKRLIRPQVTIRFVQWKKLCTRLTKDLAGSLHGEFIVITTPPLKLDRTERQQLRKVLADVMVKKASGMTKGNLVDLGPMILAQFPSWPCKTDVKRDPQPQIVKTAVTLGLLKTSDHGCSVEPGSAMSDAHLISEEIEAAISALLEPNTGEMLKANKQLGLAKEVGAKETILLLDCHRYMYWRPEIVEGILADMDLNSMSNVDVIYLVEAPHNRVAKVWRSKIRIDA